MFGDTLKNATDAGARNLNLTLTGNIMEEPSILNKVVKLTLNKYKCVGNVQVFINLVTLNCAYNQLTLLPILPLTLKTLDCSYNKLTLLIK